MGKIHPCLWFNDQADEAAKFYTKVFKKGRIKQSTRYGEEAAKATGQKPGSVMTVEFSIENQTILALNGGPEVKHTPALSFFVKCDSEEEIAALWKQLADGGEVHMDLNQYPWAQRYGWTKDRYGVEWQLMIAPYKEKIVPAFLFVKDLFGKGEAALQFYTSVFSNSQIEAKSIDESTQTIAHCLFTLEDQEFVLMEGQGDHQYTFSPAFSLMVHCENQEEIDTYWSKLSQGGSESRCGWLTDRFGVSWQIVPAILSDLMSDPKKADSVMHAVMQMSKLNLRQIKTAAEKV